MKFHEEISLQPWCACACLCVWVHESQLAVPGPFPFERSLRRTPEVIYRTEPRTGCSPCLVPARWPSVPTCPVSPPILHEIGEFRCTSDVVKKVDSLSLSVGKLAGKLVGNAFKRFKPPTAFPPLIVLSISSKFGY